MSQKLVSVRAELAVLRGMCSRDKVVAGTLLSNVDSTYFYSPESVELFEGIQRYMGANGESPTYKLLIEDPELSNEARAHMRDSQVTIQTVIEANKAALILNKYRQTRGLYNIAAHIGECLKDSKIDVNALMQDTATAINIVRSKKSTAESFVNFGKNNSSNKLVTSILYDDNTEDVIPTGFANYDKVSGGFARGALVTIGANSGGGKSTLASSMCVNMASLGYKVLLVPLEMSSREMTARIMANVTNTDLTKILLQRLATNERELVHKRYKRWVTKVKEKGGQYTIFKPLEDMNIEEVMASISTHECDVVIVDYISLLKGVDGDDQWRALGSVARYAKINAETMNRVNILLCQVDDTAKIRYARSISEHSSSSWVWVVKKEDKTEGKAIIKVEQPKSRNSLAFPFMLELDYAKMRANDVTMDDSMNDEVVTKRGPKIVEKLPNLANSDSDV